MIESKDRSYYFGASDVDKIVGKWGSPTFCKWWLQKLGINRDSFSNRYTEAGTYFEHRILKHLNVYDMLLDKQIIIEPLRLRVNLDGNTESCIYECKTYKYDPSKIWKPPRKYINQVQIQMFASGIHTANIVAYGLVEKDYTNYLSDIDDSRLSIHSVQYDEQWIKNVYFPKHETLLKHLIEGSYPI